MSKNWKDVKREIMEEVNRIWFEAPDEVKMVAHGYYPSGAGVRETVFGNQYNLCHIMQTMSYGAVAPLMYKMIDDDDFTLEQCIKAFKFIGHKHGILAGGTYDEKHNYPWLNLGTFRKLYEDFEDCLETIPDKETLRDMVWVLCDQYCERLVVYFQTDLPWALATKRMDEEGYRRMVQIADSIQ